MQLSLHHETINDALRDVIIAAGGNKAVGTRLFPDLPVEHAAGKVRDCLNHDRRERFTPDQVCYILRLGHEVGCHAAMAYLAHSSGYASPVPVEPEDEVARLQREFVEASKQLMLMASRIDTLQTKQTIRSVA